MPAARPVESLSVSGGGRPLNGAATVSGFKHSLVTVVAAACTARKPVLIRNCPDIAETSILAEIVRDLGGEAIRVGDCLSVDGSGLRNPELSNRLADRIHGVVYLLPALLRRCGAARVPAAGGCQIGEGPGGRRPVEQYLSVLRRFGARSQCTADGSIEVSAARLRGCEIDLLDYTSDRHLRTGPLYSGATKMALLTAVQADGVTVLRNPYPKPDVSDAVSVLRQVGADIEPAADGSLIVRGDGGSGLRHPADHVLLPDLIEVVTLIAACSLFGSAAIEISGGDMKRAARALAPEFDVLDRFGVRVDIAGSKLVVHPADVLRPADFTVASHGVFSDSQPFLALLAAHAAGQTRITETVWPNRFGYVPGLAALGIRLSADGSRLVVDGPWGRRCAGQRIAGADLRAAAVLLVAALGVRGTTIIGGTEHLARGYADLPATLRALGASICLDGDR